MTRRIVLAVALLVGVLGSVSGQDLPPPTAPMLRDDSGLWEQPDDGVVRVDGTLEQEQDDWLDCLYDAWLIFTLQWGID